MSGLKLIRVVTSTPTTGRVAAGSYPPAATRPAGTARSFAIDAFAKTCLIEGLDDIRLTLRHEAQIAEYEKRSAARTPWVFDPQDAAS